ncbi:hypothetical protein CLAIMM_00685, partial [Cladophialophora immunda]
SYATHHATFFSTACGWSPWRIDGDRDLGMPGDAWASPVTCLPPLLRKRINQPLRHPVKALQRRSDKLSISASRESILRPTAFRQAWRFRGPALTWPLEADFRCRPGETVAVPLRRSGM